jgi:8-oxo-dGTP pyrophosphatase MutT (NUDIX family)
MSNQRPPKTRKLPNVQARPRDAADTWVDGPQGRFWGLFGAAGLLVATPRFGVLLQHRAQWSHFGGTWGLPGGARKEGESAEQAALREAGEEAGVPADAIRLFDRHVTDHGYWSYTTVLAVAPVAFDPVIADAESQDLAWVPVDSVADYPLHPVFAQSWSASLADRVRSELARVDGSGNTDR